MRPLRDASSPLSCARLTCTAIFPKDRTMRSAHGAVGRLSEPVRSREITARSAAFAAAPLATALADRLDQHRLGLKDLVEIIERLGLLDRVAARATRREQVGRELQVSAHR